MHGMQHGYGFIFKRSLPHNCEVKTRYNAHAQKQVQEAAKVARQQAKTERERERKQRAEELAAQRALKKLQRDAATAKKTYDTANK
ncbi:hypothetical protein A1F96_11185, partial [Pyrenophora tritici-repentis]